MSLIVRFNWNIAVVDTTVHHCALCVKLGRIKGQLRKKSAPMRGFMRHLCAGVINICTLRHVEYNFFSAFIFTLLFCSVLEEEKMLPAVCGILNILYVHCQQDNNDYNTLQGVVALGWEREGVKLLSLLILRM